MDLVVPLFDAYRRFYRLASDPEGARDLRPAQVRFQLVQGGFDFPPLMIERRQFLGRSLLVIECRGDQPVDRFGVLDVFQPVIDDADWNSLPPLSPL